MTKLRVNFDIILNSNTGVIDPMLPSIMWPDINMAKAAVHIAMPAGRSVCNPTRCPRVIARPIA